jgi:hypothetical protein
MDNLPVYHSCFNVVFDNEHIAKAVRISRDDDPEMTLRLLGFESPRAAIFISGGASYMSEEDRQRTKEIIAGVGAFAEENDAIIFDGGTESGVMQMIGDVRLHNKYTFPLIGVSPLGKVSFPGYKNPNEEAFLEDSHSHFVLVDGENWGDESHMILKLTQTIAAELPAVGILINGGKIAMQEVYLATSQEINMPVIVLEGSGRAADEISTAFRTGKANQAILQAILSGGDIQLVGTLEGPEAMRTKLAQKFGLIQ